MEDLTPLYRDIRNYSLSLAEPLSPEDCSAQSMPDTSPVKWHLAHTTWFFETFILEPYLPGYKAYDPAFRYLFNSYYEGVGTPYPRDQRGLITRPNLEVIRTYRTYVDQHLQDFCLLKNTPQAVKKLIQLGLHHEQQHQELILTDVKHLLSLNPLKPNYSEALTGQAPLNTPRSSRWIECPGGLIWIGAEGHDFCFDNELPRHKQYLEPYRLASRLVSNQDYLDFILDGGYETPEIWLSDGWHWAKKRSIQSPLYWHREDNHWFEFTLHGLTKLDPSSPVVHVSFYEADAYARWAGARLPKEAEWESAVANTKAQAILNAQDRVWQWTSSAYEAYPGFTAAAGPVGEYNGKFMINQMVLKGGSSVTPPGHTRTTYRNFFPPQTRWQYSGIRLAMSLSTPIQVND